MSVTCIKCATTLCAPNFLLPGVRLKLALFSLVLLLRSNLLEIFHFDTDHKDKGWQSVVFFFRGRYFIWIMIFNGLWSKTVSCSVVRFCRCSDFPNKVTFKFKEAYTIVLLVVSVERAPSTK